jgi:hypothetical protein
MTNWRQILSYKTEPEEFKVGDRVKFKDGTPYSQRMYDVLIETNMIGTIIGIDQKSLHRDQGNRSVHIHWELPARITTQPDKYAREVWLEHAD